MSGVPYTKEQEEWLRDNFNSAMTYSQMAIEFNARFNATRTPGSLSDKCTKQMKLKNKPNLTSYGNKSKEQLPIGSIRKTGVATYIKVKEVPEKAHISGYPQPYWLPLQRKIYQDAYGEIGHNQMVCFLDNNPENFALENLYPIDRRISAILSTEGWWSKNPDITLTAIKWCELHYAIKGG